ncbi:zinc finger protein 432-like [Condylostylus longicornis]|uniref:zinc finger protein 432-like n=1 Tax=Condylostylus longicornis TaxID=2530218 RepID=UPI00244E3A2E|nr:zinc finger protein 432-like [Condylostylus longicornis]
MDRQHNRLDYRSYLMKVLETGIICGYSEDSNDLEPEIKIQKYESSDEESFILNNSSEYFNSDNDTRISGSTSTICGNSEYVVSCPNEEKTIEIYKEDYIPEKPKFILAAVNLPIKSNISKNSDDSLSTTDADPEAFPQDEVVSNNEVIDKEYGFFYCPECFKRYKRIESLRYHYLSHTGVPAPYQCSICHKGFPSAYKVRIHFTKHTGERPFRCHLCPRS